MTTIQDLGRPGYQHLGIPVSGALDPVSLRAANALVGNAPGTGALEVAYVGPTLAVEADDVRHVVRRRRRRDRHSSPTSTRRPARASKPCEASACGAARWCASARCADGAVLYVAVEGGFDIAPVLGSVSTYLRGGFGGWQGGALVAGDRLPLRRNARERAR